MFRLPAYRTLLSALTVFIFSSCGLIDLRPIKVIITPSVSNTVLERADSPISISFNTEMDKKEIEKIITVGCDTEVVECDNLWQGNVLTLIPIKGWAAGTRYLISVSGFARSNDGRELRLEKYIYFFAVNKSMPPLVDWHNPMDGGSISANNSRLEIHFSQPMDRLSAESSLSIEGMGDKYYEWSNDDKVLTIISDRTLSPWTLYRWSLSVQAKSKEGVPLAQRIAASFITDMDRIMPEVENVYPVIQSQGKWLATGGSLEEGFGPSAGLAIEFNKPMGDTVLRSLRFEPSLSGKTEKLSDKSILFIPNLPPEPETVYTLIISGDTKDAEGLKIGKDYRRSFIADIPFMKVLGISALDGASLDSPALEKENILQVSVSEPMGGLVLISIHFSLMLDKESKQKTALAITLSPFFPINLDPIALRSAAWVSDDRLIMEWERLQGGSAAGPNFYRLLIPGGRNGIVNGEGVFLKNDICIYLEVKDYEI